MTFASLIEDIVIIWQKYWQLFLFKGLTTTLQLTALAVALGVVLGTVVAMMKMSKVGIIRFIATVYIEVIRGTPILLQLFIFVFALPALIPIKLSYFTWTAIALSINSAAYVSEVIRSGIQAVDKGQAEAARSLGLSERQTVRNILPALGNEFIMILKETSLASTFYVGDLMTQYNIVKGATYQAFQCLIIVGIIYLCITFPLSKLVSYLEKRMSNPKSYRAHNRKLFAGGKLQWK